MRRALTVLLVLAVIGGALYRSVPRSEDAVPTLVVTKARFVRSVTAEGNLRAVQAKPIVVPEIDGVWSLKVAWLANDGIAVKAGDVIARFERTLAEKQLRDARAELATVDAQLREAKLKAAASDADHAAAVTLAQQEAKHARDFQAVDPVLFSRNQIIESQMDEELAVARQRQAEQTRTLDRGVAKSEIAILTITRDRAALAVQRAEAALAHLEVRAPNDGVLVLHRDDGGEIPKLGSRVYTGDTLAELPVPGAMEAEVFVLEADGSGLDVGQRASIVVDAAPDRVFHGTVRLVDKLAKPRLAGSSMQYFAAVVALDTTDPALMKPAARVRATLVLADRDAIAVPRHAVFERGGTSIVFRKSADGFAPVAVELGVATAGRVVVTTLAEGDVIALRDPGGVR